MGGGGDDLIDIQEEDTQQDNFASHLGSGARKPPTTTRQPPTTNRTGTTTRKVYNEPMIDDEDLGLDDFAERSERLERL